MEILLDPTSLVFLIPLALGALLLFGTVDMGDDDGDSDGDHPMSVLGFGRYPTIIVLGAMGLLYGGAGSLTNMALRSHVDLHSGWILLSIFVALNTMLFGTRALVGLMRRVMPTTTTSSTTLLDLAGTLGTAVTEIDSKHGVVQVTLDGDVFQFLAVVRQGTLPKGSTVVLVDHDQTHVWTVSEACLDEKV